MIFLLITYKFYYRSHRLRVRTVGFQSTNRGSNPRGTANIQLNFILACMNYFVYLIGSLKNLKIKTYVGYTDNLKKRLTLHNKGKGAKSTRGRTWRMLYFKKYNSKKEAMVEEYKLKKNRKKRGDLKSRFLSTNRL